MLPNSEQRIGAVPNYGTAFLGLRTIGSGEPDLVFPRLKKIIFVHGCFWHMHTCGRCRIPQSRRHYWLDKLKRNAQRDQRTRLKLRRMGWTVLTIWECETRKDRLTARLLSFLNE
jgi:DNA mismatch endonuclease (patch repair protein)